MDRPWIDERRFVGPKSRTRTGFAYIATSFLETVIELLPTEIGGSTLIVKGRIHGEIDGLSSQSEDSVPLDHPRSEYCQMRQSSSVKGAYEDDEETAKVILSSLCMDERDIGTNLRVRKLALSKTVLPLSHLLGTGGKYIIEMVHPSLLE